MNSLRTIFFLLFLSGHLLVTTACAKKNYQDEDSKFSASENTPRESESSTPPLKTCPLVFPKSKLCAKLHWQITQSEDSYGQFLLEFYQMGPDGELGPLVNPATTLSVMLFMPDMGHGSSPVTIENVGPGLYLIDDVFFNMPGEWDIRIQLKNDHQIFEQAIEKIFL